MTNRNKTKPENENKAANLNDDLRAFSIPEVLERVPCGRTTLYKEMNSGRLRAIEVGGRRAITARALRDWLDRSPAYRPTSPPTAKAA